MSKTQSPCDASITAKSARPTIIAIQPCTLSTSIAAPLWRRVLRRQNRPPDEVVVHVHQPDPQPWQLMLRVDRRKHPVHLLLRLPAEKLVLSVVKHGALSLRKTHERFSWLRQLLATLRCTEAALSAR